MENNYLTYSAVFEKTSDGGYNVSFPHISGCYTCGDDFTEAFENARDVLTLMLIDILEKGNELPYNGLYYPSSSGKQVIRVKTHDLSKYKKKHCLYADWSVHDYVIKSVTEKYKKLKEKKQVIIINGMAQSGKSTFVELFQKHYKAINFSSVDKVKEIAKTAGWSGSKTEKDRKFLSDMKKLLTEYNDLPFSTMQVKYNEFLSDESEFLFLHIREPEEIKRAKKEFNAKTLLIKNNRVKNIDSNDSDKNVENYHYDYTILNNGSLNDLEEKADEFGRILNSSINFKNIKNYSMEEIKNIISQCQKCIICKKDGIYCNDEKVGDYVRY